MANIFADGEELVTLKQLLKNKSIQKFSDVSDLNNQFNGFRTFNGKLPENAPANCSAWGIVGCFPLGQNTETGNAIQFVFDLNGLFMYRTYDGSTGTMAWRDWKKIPIG